MSADYTISGVKAFEGYPFPFVRVYDLPELGICAVTGFDTELGVFLIPNVTPTDIDSYEVEKNVFGVWKSSNEVYGVSWMEH